MSELILLKLGGSIISKKDEGKAVVINENLKRIAREIKESLEEKEFRLVIVHGGGSFGHVLVKEYELEKGLGNKERVMGFVKTHQSMEELNFQVVDFLQKGGLKAMAFQPSASGIMENKKLVRFSVEVVERMIELGIIPVSYGDMLLDNVLKAGVLSGDHLVPYLAEKLRAKRVVLATDVRGVYDNDPVRGGEAVLIPEINSRSISELEIGNSGTTDVTGGMKRKVEELLRIAGSGIEIQIISGLEKDFVKRALLGEHVGTLVRG